MRVSALTVVLMALSSAPAFAQSRPEAYSFYTISGSDTVAVEQVVRMSDRIDVDMLLRAEGVRFQFTLDVNSDAAVERVTNRFYRQPADEEPTQTVTVVFRGDSADVEISGNRSRAMTVGAIPGALPWIRPSNTVIEQMLMRAQSADSPIDSVPVFNVANGQSTVATVEWSGPERATIQFAEAFISASVGEDGQLLGLTARGQRGRVVRQDAFARMPIEEVDYGAPDGAPYAAEDVTVRTRSGLSLSGTLTLPGPGYERSPAVVTITGSGPHDRDERTPGVGGYRPYWDLADTLARSGIATLRLDDRGVNDSDPGPEDATFLDYVDDVLSALDYLRAHPSVDGSRLALIGHSQGGLIAPLVAGVDSTLAGIVLLAAPGYVGERAFEAQRWADLDPRYVAEEERASAVERIRRADADRAVRDPNLRVLLEYDPIPTARMVTVPVLIVQGETDRQVTPEQADTLAGAIRSGGNSQVSVHRLPAVNHLLLDDPRGWSSGYSSLPSKSISRAVLSVVVDWLAEHLNREAA